MFMYDNGESVAERPMTDEDLKQAAQVFSEDQVYNSFLYKARFIETDYLPALIERIHAAPLTRAAQIALWTICSGLFEKSVVLAKEKDPESALWTAEIIILTAKQAFTSHDADQPELYVIINMILEHYAKFISRSEGGWERQLQNKIETSHTHANVQKIVGPKLPRRGFRIGGND
jgi:hypothetical protein